MGKRTTRAGSGAATTSAAPTKRGRKAAASPAMAADAAVAVEAAGDEPPVAVPALPESVPESQHGGEAEQSDGGDDAWVRVPAAWRRGAPASAAAAPTRTLVLVLLQSCFVTPPVCLSGVLAQTQDDDGDDYLASEGEEEEASQGGAREGACMDESVRPASWREWALGAPTLLRACSCASARASRRARTSAARALSVPVRCAASI
jgi:hypothetical protein